ncbi:LysR substrate-binding domain-containing protein [Pacificispira sp.]|uniref:LysR family transcriptional regulator n=1 Tax=Pacificispira sp. TaxID=2888761 RepID=UPI003B5219CB
MNLSTLRLLSDVARLGSFAAVARERDVDPSAISRAVAAAEDELALRLFQRTTRRVALTEAGAAYLARIEPLIEELEQARQEATDLAARPMGTIRLTASIAFTQVCLVPLLPAFRDAFPDLALDLIASDGQLDLVENGIDLAIRLGPPPETDVTATRLRATRYRVCVSPSYQQDPATRLNHPSDLTRRRCLRQSLPEYQSRWMFRDGAGQETEVPVTGDLRVSNAIALRDCAEMGLGPALLVDWLTADAFAQGRLIDPFPGHTAYASSADTGIWLIYSSRRYLPLKTRVTLDFLKAHLPSRLGPATAS